MLWSFPQVFPILGIKRVHVWRAQLKRSKEELAELSSLLNSQEKERAAKFMVEHARNNFIVARGILRRLLAGYLQVDPQDLSFRQNKYGKLYLEFPGQPPIIQFNISHSHGLAMFVFTLHYSVGVDVEFVRNGFDFISIAQRFFSKTESTELLALPQDQQLIAFFNCWSRKEAFVKAIGKGLFCALDKFSVEVSNKTQGSVQLRFVDNKYDAENWSLEALNPADGYVGAFVISLSKYQSSFYSF